MDNVHSVCWHQEHRVKYTIIHWEQKRDREGHKELKKENHERWSYCWYIPLNKLLYHWIFWDCKANTIYHSSIFIRMCARYSECIEIFICVMLFKGRLCIQNTEKIEKTGKHWKSLHLHAYYFSLYYLSCVYYSRRFVVVVEWPATKPCLW